MKHLLFSAALMLAFGFQQSQMGYKPGDTVADF